MGWLTDLTPFASDRCWQFVLLARQAPVGVVIRRGPSKWWHLSTELSRFESHWADFDQRGRLVAAAGGRILEGKFDRRHGLRWRQLAAFQDEKPERMETPEWARHW